MKVSLVDVKRVADSLQAQCPFITFAMIDGIDEQGQHILPGNLELFVMLENNTGLFLALEKILQAMAMMVPGVLCDVTILNRVDVTTCFKASNARCLFVRYEKEQMFRQFVQRACLDYRILNARRRLNSARRNDQF